MGGISLYDYQLDAINRMKNGCILCGGVGSGKSRTSLAYYYKQQGGNLFDTSHRPMQNPKGLYIITTARKRQNAPNFTPKRITGLSKTGLERRCSAILPIRINSKPSRSENAMSMAFGG